MNQERKVCSFRQNAVEFAVRVKGEYILRAENEYTAQQPFTKCQKAHLALIGVRIFFATHMYGFLRFSAYKSGTINVDVFSYGVHHMRLLYLFFKYFFHHYESYYYIVTPYEE